MSEFILVRGDDAQEFGGFEMACSLAQEYAEEGELWLVAEVKARATPRMGATLVIL